MANELSERCVALVEELGLGLASDVANVTPLTGGVASDIASLSVKGRKMCIKFALPKLKVAADWSAPVHRNAAEYAWLKVAAEVCPNSAVQLYGRSEAAHGFAMEFVTGADVYLWKEAMLSEQPLRGEARQVAEMVVQIHAASAKPEFDRSAFNNRDDFRAIRIEPYLLFTAQQHPDLAEPLNALAEMLYNSDQVLVHGDVSPKNILLRKGGPVLLDAECATMGDASFDPSFCLNHLVLKAVHLPSLRSELLQEIGVFWRTYAAHIDWEPAVDLEARVCQLLPALMLGRVDGKSPVEYFSEDERTLVRAIAKELVSQPATTLAEFVERLEILIKDTNS
ncbi:MULTISPECIES: phosphotransferase family protein [Halocynthiibacter]|uniref:Aminoglycoside phosphotransferase family protein n=1 Tax=Halocynthiibacter halioticoli TaxID=2986804 RepID=A0AAE3LUR8_9RHOB|nr:MULTISPECIES: aminoglycoside phosphotransferase family protein [Halocynthiibacter]MCV6825480.1 aminoglycoside phosphotransferase family protein [Halocynthiibacter halioticoli]MCW4058481.1 aminoglycoside phosphotransferase family protein [Halocynthiibacter sp. SDUM655004]